MEYRREEFDEMVKTFEHVHVNNGYDDFCNQCGLYLTHEVHTRAQVRKPVSSATTMCHNDDCPKCPWDSCCLLKGRVV
jgi:hypothetical protein